MKKGHALIELMFIVVLGSLVLGVLFGFPLWTQRNLDFWISHFKGHAVHVPYWLAFIAGWALNGFALLGNIIAEIARYFL